MLAALAVVVPAAGRAPRTACPHDASLGRVRFVRAGTQHVVSLATCSDRIAGRARPSAPAPLRTTDGRFVARVRATGSGRNTTQTIWVTDERTHRSHPVVSEPASSRHGGGRETSGLILLHFTSDGRWIVFAIEPGHSNSLAADGLALRVVAANGGRVRKLGPALPAADYLASCAGGLAFIGGGDRIATHAKRLLFARPPRWRARPLWRKGNRSFASPTCAPDQQSVAVLSQRGSDDAAFFSTRWELWRVALTGSHTLLDAPPRGFADESPLWSRDGRSLLFVRERNGYGRLMLWRAGHVIGPFAELGYSLGYYGHHEWNVQWSVGAS